nr:MAG TPA: hypothetical protein [Caudoviricetes sp.]
MQKHLLSATIDHSRAQDNRTGREAGRIKND